MPVRFLLCLLFGAMAVWFAEGAGLAIAHSSGGLGLLALLSPGMIPVFFGAFENEYLAWSVAAVLNALYFLLIVEVVRTKAWRRPPRSKDEVER